ncbi:MAG: hypothetical protein ABL999_03430 [Pyrinomonadaceae bacterium]
MNKQLAPTKMRSCYKCGFYADTVEVKCPQCGRILHTATATRIRGLLLMLCGVFLMAIIGYISIWMLDAIYIPGPSKAQFTGTQEEKLGIFALFAGIIVFGLGSFITGAWQAAFGRRNKTLSWIVVGVGILIFAGGGGVVWLFK